MARDRGEGGFTKRKVAPEKQLGIINAMLDGKSIRETAKEFSVSASTVESIWYQIKQGGTTSFEAKRSAFMTAVENFGTATMKMLTAQAEMLSDPSYTANKTTEHVIAHSAFVRDSFERIVRLQSAVTARLDAALPETTEIVRAEIVDEAA